MSAELYAAWKKKTIPIFLIFVMGIATTYNFCIKEIK